MPLTQNSALGKLGEDLAADFLEKEGYKIVGRNLRFGKNEIDIICEDEDFTVFVEVKTRTCQYPESNSFGIPASAVDHSKRKNTVTASRSYLASHYTGKQPRIDVIEVYMLDGKEPMLTPKPIKINHIRNAFDARGRKLF